MTEPMRALVAVDAGIDAHEVRAVLDRADGIATAGVFEGLETSWNALSEGPSDAVIVACPTGSEQALWFIRETSRRYPDRPVVVLTQSSANGFVREVFEAGADDLVMPPPGDDPRSGAVAHQLRFAVEKAVARRNGGGGVAAPTALASLICVLGPKGGIGKTLTSANLAVGLAMNGRKVTVVDLDLQFGDVGLSLGLAPKRTVYDLVKSGGSLDAEKIEAYLTPHSSGVRVLMAPVRPDQAAAVTIDFLRDVYALLRSCNEFVVVDTPPGFTPEVIASIDSSTHVCMLGMLDSLSLKNTKLGLETLELMGYKRSRIRTVLNRADTDVGVTREDVASVLGRPPDVLIPSNRDVVRSINEGTAIVQSRPRGEVARAFRSLVALYDGAESHSRRRPRLLRRG